MGEVFACIFAFTVLGLLILIPILQVVFRIRFKNNAKQIEVGMSKSTVIDIMGPKYSRSIEKNGDEILEWVKRKSGGGIIWAPRGVGFHSNNPGYEMTITVTFNQGKAIAVSTHNIG